MGWKPGVRLLRCPVTEGRRRGGPGSGAGLRNPPSTILQSIAERQNEAETRMGQAEARMERFDRRMRYYIRVGARQITEIREVQKRTDLTLEKLARRLDEVTDK